MDQEKKGSTMSETIYETDEQREIIFLSQNGWVEWVGSDEIEWEGPDVSAAEKDLLRDYEKLKCERDSLRDSLAKTIRQRDEAIASMSVAPMTGRQLSAMWVKHFGDCDGAWDALAAHIWPNQQPQPNQHEQLTSEKAAVQLLRTTAEFVVSDLLAYIDIGHPEVDNWAKKYRGHFQYRATDFPTLGNAMDVLRVMLQATAPEEDQHSQPDRREQLRGRVKRMDHGDCVVILELESKVAIAQDSIHGICWSCPTETGLQYVKSKSEAIAAATEWLVDEAMKAEKID